MTTDTNAAREPLRDVIARTIAYEARLVRDVTMDGVHRPMSYHYRAADIVIALFREAMLSDEALEALALSVYGEDRDSYSVSSKFYAKDHIAAAFDAVTGEVPDGQG